MINLTFCKSTLLFFCLFLLASIPLRAAEFSIEEEADAIVVKIDGELFTRYVIEDEAANMPYFYPVIGPGGKPMTRSYPMKDVEGEAQDHPHQRSFYFAHQLINDFDTWHEDLTLVQRAKGDKEKLAEMRKRLGSNVHREVLEKSVEGNRAILKVASDYLNAAGEVAVRDERHFTFQVGDKGERIVDFDIVFTAVGGEASFADAKDAGLSVRVAQTLCVDAGEGGKIVNSEGYRDKDAWGKRAAWCSFTGLVEGEIMGISILNHPSSFRHPTPWHARTYGLFTANPFGLNSVAGEEKDGVVKLAEGKSFTLRHRVIFHAGDGKEADIEGAWEIYSSSE